MLFRLKNNERRTKFSSDTGNCLSFYPRRTIQYQKGFPICHIRKTNNFVANSFWYHILCIFTNSSSIYYRTQTAAWAYPLLPPSLLAWGYQILYSTVHGLVIYSAINRMIDGKAGIQNIHTTTCRPQTTDGCQWLPQTGRKTTFI